MPEKKCFLCNEKINTNKPYQEILKRVYNIDGSTIAYYRHFDCDVYDLGQLLVLIEPEAIQNTMLGLN